MALTRMVKRGIVYFMRASLTAVASVAALSSCGVARAQPGQPGQKPPVSLQRAIPLDSKSKKDPEQLIKVATLHTNEGAFGKVRTSFKEAQIPVMIMGQRMYGVLVKRKDRDRAIRLLKASSKKLHYSVQFN